MKEKDFKMSLIMIGMSFVSIILVVVVSIYSINKISQVKEVKTNNFSTKEKVVFDEYLTRLKINDKIKKEMYYSSEDFYAEITKDEEIGKIILSNALKKNVPVNVAFSIAKVESVYNKKVVSIPNSDGSVDRGLFQLNDGYFKVDWQDPETNTKEALNYLLSRKEITDTWEGAIMLYNAGNISNVSSYTFNYVKKVLEEEKKLDKKFNDFRRNININAF